MGFIYVLRSGETNYYKIGMTKNNVQSRITQSQIGNPELLTLVFSYETKDEVILENMLHLYHRKHWIRGEWFVFNTFNPILFLSLVYSLEPKNNKIPQAEIKSKKILTQEKVNFVKSVKPEHIPKRMYKFRYIDGTIVETTSTKEFADTYQLDYKIIQLMVSMKVRLYEGWKLIDVYKINM